MARNPTWVQQDYRFYADDAAQGSATALAAINTSINAQAGAKFRVRINFGDSNNATQNNVRSAKLQYSVNGGTWTDVGAATAVRYATSSFVSDGTNYSTELLANIIGTVFDGTLSEFDSNNATTSQTWTDDYTEYEFCVELNGPGAGDTVTFRVVTSSDEIPSITNTPTVNVTGAADALTATGITSSPVVGTPTLAEQAEDALTAVGITTTPVVASGASAVTATGRYNAKGTLSGTPAGFTTGSVSYNAGSVLVAIVDTADNTSNNTTTGTTFTGGGLTWTKRQSRDDISQFGYNIVHEVWTAEPSSSGSSTFTWQRAAGAQVDSGWGCQIIEIEGQAASWLGTSKVEACTTAGSYTLTLSASPASSSLVLAYRCAEGLSVTSSPATPGTGWTEIYDYAAGHNGWDDIQSMYRGNSTSTSVTWDQIGTAGQIDTGVTTVGAIEFIASMGGPTLAEVPVDALTATGITASPIVGAPTATHVVNLTATGIATGAPSTGGGAGGTVVHTNLISTSIPQTISINWTSGSFTPADNSLLVVTITWQRDSYSTPTRSVSGGGLTWTEREYTLGPSSSDFGVSIWTAPVTTGASMTVNFQLSHTTSSATAVINVDQFTGINTSSPVGLHNTAFLGVRSGSYNLSLGGTTAADSMVLGVGSTDEGTTTFAAGWTNLQYTESNWNYTQTAKKTGAMSVVDYSTLATGWTATAGGIEIKAGAGSGPTLEDVAPTGDALTATGITASPVVGTPTATHIHNLSATGITASPTVGTPVLTALDVLTATGISTGAPLVTHYAIPTATHLVNYQATPGSSPVSVTTGSFTPSDNVLLVAVVGFSDTTSSNNTANTTLSGGGLTWTKRTTYNAAPGGLWVSAEIYTAPVTTGASMTVTHTRSTARSSASCSVEIHISEITNYNTASPTGATMAETSAKDGPVSGTLSSLPGTNSLVIGARACDAVNATPLYADPGTGWTELADGNTQNPYWMTVQDQYRVDPQTTSVTWNDIAVNSSVDLVNILIGVEILAARYPVVEDVAGTSNLTSVGIAASPVVGAPDVAQIKPAVGQLDAALSWTSTAGASRPRSAQLDATLALTSQAGALRPRSAQLDATAAVSANGDAQKTGTASLTVSLTASASAQATRYRSASLTISLTKGVAAQALRYRSSTQTTNLTLVVSAGANRPRSAQLDGSLAIAASAGIVRDASAALTASGTLASSGERVRVGSAALAASVGIASTAVVERSGSSSLGVALAISSSANASRPASASVTAAATATTSASAIKSVSAALAANLSLIAVPAGTAVGSIAAAATLSSSAQATRPRSAQLDTNLSVVVSGNAYRPRSAQLDATLSTTVAAQATRPASATLNTAAVVSASGQASRTASATLSIAGVTQGTAGAIRQGSASLTAALTFLALPAGAGAAFMTAGLSLSVSAQADKQRSAALTAALSTLASAQAIRPVAASLTTSLSLAASATGLGEGSATLTTSATLSASADRYAYRSSTLASTASVASSAERISGATTTMATVLSVAASAGAIRPASSQMDAALSVNGQPTGNFVRSASLAAVATITADGLNKPRFTINLEARLSLRCGWGAAPKKAIVAVKAGSVRPEPSAGKVRPGVTAGRVNVKIM